MYQLNAQPVAEIVKGINEVFCQHGIETTIMPEDIIVYKIGNSSIIYDGEKRVMSEAIRTNIFPEVKVNEFYHFTKKDSAESILSDDKLWLTNISKRFCDDELIDFFSDHKLFGYLRTCYNGKMLYQTELDDTYYISLTSTSITDTTEGHCWKHFAKCKKSSGVRLKIKITPLDPFIPYTDILFRKIYYGDSRQPIQLLMDLRKKVKEIDCNLNFIFKSITTIAGLYLNSGYKIEDEYRFLYKYYDPDYLEKLWIKLGGHPTPPENRDLPPKRPAPVDRGDSGYVVEIPLNQSCKDFNYRFEVVEICTNDKLCVLDKYKSIIIRRR